MYTGNRIVGKSQLLGYIECLWRNRLYFASALYVRARPYQLQSSNDGAMVQLILKRDYPQYRMLLSQAGKQ